MQDAIGHSKIRDITRTRDDRTAQAIETAVSSINHAEALGRVTEAPLPYDHRASETAFVAFCTLAGWAPEFADAGSQPTRDLAPRRCGCWNG